MNAAPGATWDRLVLDCPLPRLEARMLLEAASGRRREWLIGHGDEAADAQAASRFVELARRRRDGEPIAYLTGSREFAGRSFDVTRDVLIPRPETELLAHAAIERAPHAARILDLGTGSGAIAVTLVAERDDVSVVATDASERALEVAVRNARRLCAAAFASKRLQFRSGDWWDAIDGVESFDVVVSNPPYVAQADPHLAQGDLRFEPAQALVGGTDGLRELRRIVAGAPRHLRRGGWLLVEHGHDQGAALRSMLATGSWHAIRTLDDAAGIGRITVARAFL